MLKPMRILAAVAAAGLSVALWAQAGTAPVRPVVSPEETAAVKALQADFNDPSTTPDALDSAIANYQDRFPKSVYTRPILLLAVRYYRARGNYLRLLAYGTQVLAMDPGNLYTLSSLGAAIPDNVKQSDLDIQDRLTQAEGFDHQVITIVAGLMPTSTGLEFQGIHYSVAQVKILQDNLEGPAYTSLGRIGMLRQQYPAAVAAFRQAIAFQPTPAAQAQTYYDIGTAEVEAHQAPEAQAALAKALQLAPDSPFLQHMVETEQAKLKAEGH